MGQTNEEEEEAEFPPASVAVGTGIGNKSLLCCPFPTFLGMGYS